jgi:hypothetical protein
VTMYLRCLTGDHPRHWVQWLPWVEFCYNSTFQSFLCTTPFCVVYGRYPLVMLLYGCYPLAVPLYVHVLMLDQQLMARDEFLNEVCDRLEQAQQLYKEAYDKNHRDVTFAVEDWVWLRLLHRPIASLITHDYDKLGPCFYVPF